MIKLRNKDLLKAKYNFCEGNCLRQNMVKAPSGGRMLHGYK